MYVTFVVGFMIQKQEILRAASLLVQLSRISLMIGFALFAE